MSPPYSVAVFLRRGNTCAVAFLRNEPRIYLWTKRPCAQNCAHYDRQLPIWEMTAGQSSIHEPSFHAGERPTGSPLDLRRFKERHGIRYGYYTSRQA